jgi:hypothetical protein
MIRLDHNRALGQLAAKAGVAIREIGKLAVWGNHSPTMFADWTYATAAGRPLPALIGDEQWYRHTLVPEGRGAVPLSSKRGARLLPRRLRTPQSTTCMIGSRAVAAIGLPWGHDRPAHTAFRRVSSAAFRLSAPAVAMRP